MNQQIGQNQLQYYGSDKPFRKWRTVTVLDWTVQPKSGLQGRIGLDSNAPRYEGPLS